MYKALFIFSLYCLVTSFSAQLYAQVGNMRSGLFDQPHIEAEGFADTTVLADYAECDVELLYIAPTAAKEKGSIDIALIKLQKLLQENSIPRTDIRLVYSPISMSYANVGKAKKIKPLYYTSKASIAIKFRELSRVSAIINLITDLGVQRITPLVFKHSKKETILLEVFGKATANAQAFARAMASPVGGVVGKPIKIITDKQQTSINNVLQGRVSGLQIRGLNSLPVSGSDEVVETATDGSAIKFSASVTVYFELK